MLKYGLIPEFIGRLPVVVTLDALDKDALVRILTEPKNALVKQYKKLFEYDGCKLEFDKEAIEAIADKALERKTGARGLRAIIEGCIRDVMFELPSIDGAENCIITKDVITDGAKPEVILKKSKTETA